jgi:gliding motility-associated-like protein
LKKSLSIALLASLLVPQLSFTQSVTENEYLKVLQVSGDRVKVDYASDFDSIQPGDKVVLIQMTGGEKFFLNEDLRINRYSFIRQCGKFEILQVEEVQKVPEYLVIFTDSVFNNYDSGEKIQLVRIWESRKIIVKNKTIAREWDGNTGGIIAIMGTETIDLQADIDVSGSGFRGGQPVNFSPVNCRTSPDTVNWTEAETGRAGHKGEGIITAAYTYTKGISEALNGGGSGCGKFSGGGGGSNFASGGNGGKQYTCTNIDLKAEGGFDQAHDYWRLFCNPLTRRIIMGGGGGAGTQDTSDGREATAGGDGGGIIILVTETLIGNGGVLRSNGQSVTDVATASGGGGGAGGTILVDAAAYSGTFSIEAKGGNGGNTGINCTGAGGAGSGGILWHSGPSPFFTGAPVSLTGGTRGKAADGCDDTFLWGYSGEAGGMEDSLLLILNGFLFNTIRGTDTAICAGQQPGWITGSSPKGGNGTYTYNWQQSPNGSSGWINATGTRNQKNYQSPALTQTIYYRRIVTSEDIADYSKPVKIHVYPTITGNTITGTDTICYNLPADTILGTTPPSLAGGDESFTYKWLRSVNGTTWDTIKLGNATSANYGPGQLQVTRYYRRYVQSTPYCSHTSSPVTITVLPSVTRNSFYTADTTICRSLDPGKLNIRKPAGGEEGDYRFAWMQKSAASEWSMIAGANDTLYDPGPLDETMWYKRIVYSGNDDACTDISSEKLVTVLDSIAKNTISIDSSRYCAGDYPSQILGQTPGGGDIGKYTYAWQMRTTGAWSVIEGAIAKDCTPQMVEINTQYRRLVSSGQLNLTGQYACHSTSPALSLEVIPYIFNHLGLEDQSQCQDIIPLPFNPDPATGGDGNITYQWIAHEEGSALWNNAPGISTLSDYASDSLETTTHFARIALSDICELISDTITVTVYPDISINIIAGSPAVYTCFNTGKKLTGPGYSGGKPDDYDFLWLQSTDNTEWSPATGITNNDLEDFETSALTDSLLLRRIIYSSSAGKECADTSAPVTVRINSLPTGDVISSVDTLCAGESLDVHFTVSGEHGPWDVTIGEGDFTGSKEDVVSTSGTITLTCGKSHTIRMLEIRDDSLCYADPSIFNNEVVVNVYEIIEANAGPDDEVCGPRYTLNAEIPPPSCRGWWTVQDGSFADGTSPGDTVIMNPGIYGRHDLIWTVTDTNWYCPDNDTTSIIFYQQPVLDTSNTDDYIGVDAGPRQDLDSCRYTTQLAATLDAGTGHWSVMQGTGIISNDTMRNATVTELAVYNLLRWTIINGVCPAVKDSMEITIIPLNVPKGFSPNRDGINDVFRIPTNNDKVEKISIKIFNRAGVLVWDSNDYTHEDPWGGTFKKQNGPDLPEGTYFYIIDIWPIGKAEPLTFKSFVEILR